MKFYLRIFIVSVGAKKIEFEHSWKDGDTGIEYNAVVPEAADFHNKLLAYQFCKV